MINGIEHVFFEHVFLCLFDLYVSSSINYLFIFQAIFSPLPCIFLFFQVLNIKPNLSISKLTKSFHLE